MCYYYYYYYSFMPRPSCIVLPSPSSSSSPCSALLAQRPSGKQSNLNWNVIMQTFAQLNSSGAPCRLASCRLPPFLLPIRHSIPASPTHMVTRVGRGEQQQGETLAVSACITRLKSIFKGIRKSAAKLVQGRSQNSIRQGEGVGWLECSAVGCSSVH